MEGLHSLSTYGTLRQSNVQIEVLGRELAGLEDRLLGYVIGALQITDEAVIARSGSDSHPPLRRGTARDEIRGIVLALSASGLSKADDYEVSGYVRTIVTLDSGKKSFVCVLDDESLGESHGGRLADSKVK